jgi:hypothetical protein
MFPSSSETTQSYHHEVRPLETAEPNELSADYERGGYVLFKEMMDSKCFSLMRAEVHFDQQRNIKEQKLEGGTMMTKEEYENMTSPNFRAPTSNL